MAKKRAQPVRGVIKRAPGAERKRLPPELEAFASSDERRLRRPRRPSDPGRIDDPRPSFAVTGVANRDARTVFDARCARLRELWADGAPQGAALDRLGDELCDAYRLGLWRARRMTSFAALVEQGLGIPADQAESLAQQGAARQGVPLEPLSERDAAVWFRVEAALLPADPQASARLAGPGPRWRLEVGPDAAVDGLAAVGARLAPMRHGSEEAPRSQQRGPDASQDGPRRAERGGGRPPRRRPSPSTPKPNKKG